MKFFSVPFCFAFLYPRVSGVTLQSSLTASLTSAAQQNFLSEIRPPQVASQPDCSAAIRSFVSCVRGEEAERRDAADKEADGVINQRISACFTQQNCSAPKFGSSLSSDLSAGAQKLWANLTAWWDAQESDRRLCVTSQLRGNFRAELEDCVRAKMPKFMLKSTRDEVRLNSTEKLKLKKFAEFRFHLRVAERLCADMDIRKAQLALSCVKSARQETVDKPACTTRQKCAKQLPPACQAKWAGAIRSPICSCVSQVSEHLQKTKIVAKPVRDEEVTAKCGVLLPHMDVTEIRANPVLLHRIRDFVALHEDRLVPMCFDCQNLSV